jgi:hypothetical protein
VATSLVIVGLFSIREATMKITKMGFVPLFVVALVGILGTTAESGLIELNSDFGTWEAPCVFLWHYAGSTEGYDIGVEIPYDIPPPAIDFYSMITGYNLSDDVRPLGSTSIYHTKMIANGITGTASGTLKFAITPFDGDNFGTLPIYSDIYDKTGSLLLGNIDVRQYAQNGTTIPLSLADGDYYNIDVRFTATPEPSALTLLGIGAGLMAFGWWRCRRLGNSVDLPCSLADKNNVWNRCHELTIACQYMSDDSTL